MADYRAKGEALGRRFGAWAGRLVVNGLARLAGVIPAERSESRGLAR